jgi:short subunit dehydrogenase-like uncharacterized protein
LQTVSKFIQASSMTGKERLQSCGVCKRVSSHLKECVGAADSRGGVSGGTIESLLTVMKQDPKKLKHAVHPYSLVPEKCGKPLEELPDKGLSMAPKFSKLSNTWTGPFVMAPYNEPLVRRSSELLGYGELA